MITVVVTMISSMNQDDNPLLLNLPSAHEAFGSNLNDDDDDNEMPFNI
jgi:replicative DNA helicase